MISETRSQKEVKNSPIKEIKINIEENDQIQD